MKKRRLLFVFPLFLFCIGFSFCRGEKTFVVKEGCYVPLFETDGSKLLYHAEAHGTNCYYLCTVLLPGSLLDVSDLDKKISKVVWHANTKKTFEGYVHNEFLKNFCEEVPKNTAGNSPSPMPLKEIRTIFQRCIDKRVPYCWGGNWFEAIPLPEDYVFSQCGGKIEKAYELRGFDCSGLLYFISNALLPHSTRQLRNCGKILYKIEKNDAVSIDDLKEKLAALRLWDSDYIVIEGHVVVWYNGGVIEFRGMDYGCVFTPAEKAAERIIALIAASRKTDDNESDVRFIRWHPELLKKEFKTCFP